MAKDVNEKFRDQILVQNHARRRFENGTIREMVRPYANAKEEVLSNLTVLQRRLDEIGPTVSLEWRIARAQAQLAEIDAVLQGAALQSADVLEGALRDITLLESEFQYGMLSGAYGKLGIEIGRLPYAQIDQIMNFPMYGESIGDKVLWGNAQAVRAMRNEITQSVILGEDMTKAGNRLMGRGAVFGGSVGKKIIDRADMIARSEIQYVSNQVAGRIYAENRDVIKGVQYTATLDRRTCAICGGLDGRVYKFNEAGGHNGPIVPLHPFCRCLYSPLTYSWKELGDKATKEVSPSTRASFTGQVPSTLTYTAWLKQLDKTDPEEVYDILDKTRYKMWKQGDIKFGEMATDSKILTIDELEDKIKRKAKKTQTKKEKP